MACFYPQHADVWTDPAKQVQAVAHESHLLDALEFVPRRMLDAQAGITSPGSRSRHGLAFCLPLAIR